MGTNTFQRLVIEGWRQFASVEIDFHPRLTVVTGSNGAGKSTILRLLAQHFGWPSWLLGTPTISKSGGLSYLSGLFSWRKDAPSQLVIGSLTYTSGGTARLTLPASTGIQYNINIEGIASVVGLNISSHRPTPTYQQVQTIPTAGIGANQAYESYKSEIFNRYTNSFTQFSPTYRMKEAIISMAIFGPGNDYVHPNPRLQELFQGFKQVLKLVLPASIGFRDISIRVPDVVLVTDSGDFVIDAASGGLMSIIDIAWQIFLFGNDKDEFVVVIDEPENHLHPSMQRTLLSNLLAAFPQAQFIVATHSPFIVSSVKDSYVYVLQHGPLSGEGENARRVSSIKLDRANKAATASEILRDVLGVPVTLPDWADQELREITEQFSIEKIDSESIFGLRQALNEKGLGEYYPEALKQIAQKQ
ncbi:AAA family ATPase [Rhizobium tumorigenes]|uniref:AAA family ATPase n=1 Tax=Rhizobium tumorigenes TaxID=2041385 RepID=UPI00241EE3C8|nr:AAA family ATPase [Rhizobium tumorigenes]WFS02366.1 AAA family ATPase [Rhizobium tumorigenes]